LADNLRNNSEALTIAQSQTLSPKSAKSGASSKNNIPRWAAIGAIVGLATAFIFRKRK